MVLARPEGLRYTERENERRIPMKKTVISFLMAGLLLIGMPALAQEGDLPDPEWQAYARPSPMVRMRLPSAFLRRIAVWRPL